MRQVGLMRVRNLLDADPDQEIGHPLVVLIHRSHLAENVGLSLVTSGQPELTSLPA